MAVLEHSNAQSLQPWRVSEQLLCGCVSHDDDGVVRISPRPQLTTGINYLQLNAGTALDTNIPEIQSAVLTYCHRS